MSKEKSGKSILCLKDLQKQNDLVNKRFRKKIVVNKNGSFKCQCCAETFCSESFAKLHVKNPSCKKTVKKVKVNKKNCPEEGCDSVFAYTKDLKKHIRECHNTLFTCSLCNTNFGLKAN